MKCNKELCKRLQQAHSLWKGLYLHWNGGYNDKKIPKPLPNYHSLRGKEEIQPASIESLINNGVPSDKQLNFNWFVWRIMNMVWSRNCSRFLYRCCFV